MKRILLNFFIAFNSLVAADCSRELVMYGDGASRDQRWIEAIFKEADCRVKLLPNDKRITDRLWAVKTGKIDFLSAVTPLPERLQYASFSLPYGREKIVLLGHADFIHSTQIDRLAEVLERKITLIGPLSGYYGPEWEQLKTSFKSRRQLLDYGEWLSGGSLLIRHPHSLMLITADAATDLIARAPKKLALFPVILYETELVLLFSRKTVIEPDIAVLNEAIKRLQARGFAP